MRNFPERNLLNYVDVGQLLLRAASTGIVCSLTSLSDVAVCAIGCLYNSFEPMRAEVICGMIGVKSTWSLADESGAIGKATGATEAAEITQNKTNQTPRSSPSVFFLRQVLQFLHSFPSSVEYTSPFNISFS